MSTRDRSPRLGRGLAALLGDAARPDFDIEHSIRTLSADCLHPGPFQPRMKVADESLESLAASIRASGVLQPILVRPEPDEADAYQIIAGERRWRAAQLAGLHEMPCLVRRMTDTDAMAAGLVENLQRQDLDAMEEAEGYRRLSDDFGLIQEDVARVVGKSRSHVANMLRLLTLPATVQMQIRTGALSAGHARALLSHPEPQRAALSVITRGLNVRQTETMVQECDRPRPRRDRPSDTQSGASPSNDPHIGAIERELAEHLGLAVKLRFDGAGGSLSLQYATLDQLDMLIALLKQAP